MPHQVDRSSPAPPRQTLQTPGEQPKPQVVFRTVFHTRVNQAPPPETAGSPRGYSTLGHRPARSPRHSAAVAVALGLGGAGVPGLDGAGVPELGAASGGYEERACTLDRRRSAPRSLLDLQLSKSLSDSNIVGVSPIQVSQSVSQSVTLYILDSFLESGRGLWRVGGVY